jgi:hypothetical protein
MLTAIWSRDSNAFVVIAVRAAASAADRLAELAVARVGDLGVIGERRGERGVAVRAPVRRWLAEHELQDDR